MSLAAMERAAAKVSGPLYAIDDKTALRVVDGNVIVLSEGQWHLFSSQAPSISHQPN